MLVIANHLIYLAMGIAFTVFVGQTLFRHGKVFLLECFRSNDTAESVNRLFLSGFYLMNMAFIFLALRYGDQPTTIEDAIRIVMHRIGFVALVMGGMHFNNLFWCNLIRQHRMKRESMAVVPRLPLH